jgi:uncharacterized protein YbaR (Trm112 family)
MKNRFLCPECRSNLKVKNSVIFSAQTEKGIRGLILLSPDPGNYSIIHDSEFVYSAGEHIEFFCPVCHANLGIPEVGKDLAEVIMADAKNVEYRIIFSEIAGKRCTIKMKENKIVESWGEDAGEFFNFWGAAPKY